MKIYSHKTYLSRLAKQLETQKSQLSVLSVGLPDKQESWKLALRAALRKARKLTGFEYLCLFETSDFGYEHAHILMLRKSADNQILRASKFDYKTLRNVLVEKLWILETGKNPGKTLDVKSMEKQLKISSKKMVRIPTSFFSEKSKTLRIGQNSRGILAYMGSKENLVSQGTLISQGLRKSPRDEI